MKTKELKLELETRYTSNYYALLMALEAVRKMKCTELFDIL